MRIAYAFAFNKTKPLVVLLLVALTGVSSRVEAGAVYDFSHIADVSENYPSINNNGVVAFSGQFPNLSSGVFTGSGGALTKIGFGVQGSVLATWINDSSQVSYRENPSLGVFTIARGSGGPVTTIHTFAGGEHIVPMPVISNDGTVTYLNTNGGIYSGNGGALSTVLSIAGTNSTQYSGLFDGLAVSHNGTLAYEKYPSPSSVGGQQIVVNRSGVETSIATFPLSPGITGVSSIAINNAGTVAITGSIDIADSGIYVGDGTTLTKVVTNGASFQVSGVAAINDSGELAFKASYVQGTSIFSGIYTGSDPLANKVIQTGDALNGSTVTKLTMGTDAINDSGEVVFWAQLANGTSGVYTAASVPEPASFGAMLVCMSGLLMRRRRLYGGRQ